MPHAVRLLSPSDVHRIPWRNGGGTTTEIAVGEAPNGHDFLWRVSIADVEQSGPFSIFPDVDRLIAVIEGEGMSLSVNGGPVIEKRWMEPAFAFAGEATVDCRLLNGPIRDFNLMVQRDALKGAVHLLGPKADPLTINGRIIIVHTLQGQLNLAVSDGEPVNLPKGWSAICTTSDHLPSAIHVQKTTRATLGAIAVLHGTG